MKRNKAQDLKESDETKMYKDQINNFKFHLNINSIN